MNLIKKLFIGLHAVLLTSHVVLPATSTKIKDLSKYLRNDDVASIKIFVKENPDFDWNQTYERLGWTGKEQQTPLSAATWLGSVKSVNYFLARNIGNIRSSINTVSGKGFSPLHYATTHPRKIYPHQIAENYAHIASLLKQYDAKDIAPIKRSAQIKKSAEKK